jgi:hypothetical protein
MLARLACWPEAANSVCSTSFWSLTTSAVPGGTTAGQSASAARARLGPAARRAPDDASRKRLCSMAECIIRRSIRTQLRPRSVLSTAEQRYDGQKYKQLLICPCGEWVCSFLRSRVISSHSAGAAPDGPADPRTTTPSAPADGRRNPDVSGGAARPITTFVRSSHNSARMRWA